MRTVKLTALGAAVMALLPVVPLAVMAGWLPVASSWARALAMPAAICSLFAAASVYFIYRATLRPLFALYRAVEKPDAGGRHGTVEGLFGSLRAAGARHDAVERATGAALFELDAEGRIVYANGNALRMLGASFKELDGRSMAAFVEPGSRAAFDTLLQCVPEDTQKRFSTTLLSIGGAPVQVRVSAGAIMDDHMAAGLVVAAEKSGEVTRLAAELEKTRRDAQESEERLKKTISDLEEFALIAVRRELKMREIRERLARMSQDGAGAEPGPPRNA